jgi:hypothetical protein
LARIFKSYQWTDAVTAKKINSLLSQLAIRSHVTPPSQNLLDENKDIEAFVSSEEVLRNILLFYTQFRVAKWNDDDELDVKALNALVIQPSTKF